MTGHYIREWRRFRGVTLDALAQTVGTSAAVISRVESGAQRYNQEIIESLAAALRVTPADLITRNPMQTSDMTDVWGKIPPERQGLAQEVLRAFMAGEASRQPAPESTIPKALAAEANVIGCMLYDPGIAQKVADTGIEAQVFYEPLFQALFAYLAERMPPDLMTLDRLMSSDDEVASYKEAGGARYLADLVSDCDVTRFGNDFAAVVAAAIQRKFRGNWSTDGASA